MREILFKAKRKNWKELPKEQWWVEGYLVKKLCGKYTTIGFEEFEAYVIVESFRDGGTSYAYIDESTISQYIGLCDKNGRKIWENDIIRHEDLSSGRFVFGNQPMKNSYIKWNKAMVRFERSDWGNIYPSDSEVIGNYFDNPELLEKAR